MEHVFPKKGACFSQKRNLFLPKTELHKTGGRFSQSRWLIFPKSVAGFPKVCGRFSQSRRLIFPKSVAGFPKVCGRFFPKSVRFSKNGDGFPQSRWLIFPKSVTDFLRSVTDFPTTEPVFQKPNQFFTKTGASFFCSNKAGFSLKRIFCCCFNLYRISTHRLARHPNETTEFEREQQNWTKILFTRLNTFAFLFYFQGFHFQMDLP